MTRQKFNINGKNMETFEIKQESLIDDILDMIITRRALRDAKADFFYLWAQCKTQQEAFDTARAIDFFVFAVGEELEEVEHNLVTKLLAYPHRASVFTLS